MGLAEQETIEMFHKMRTERHGTCISEDGIAILTAARILRRAMEKCTIEICGSLEEIRDELKANL